MASIYEFISSPVFVLTLRLLGTAGENHNWSVWYHCMITIISLNHVFSIPLQSCCVVLQVVFQSSSSQLWLTFYSLPPTKEQLPAPYPQTVGIANCHIEKNAPCLQDQVPSKDFKSPPCYFFARLIILYLEHLPTFPLAPSS